MGTRTSDSPHKLEVLFVDDDPFTRAMINDGLESDQMAVRTCASTAEAVRCIEQAEPHVVVSDLDLGPGPSGADLLRKVDREWPWIAKVALTAHATVELAVADGAGLPSHTHYIVKSDLESIRELHDWVLRALSPPDLQPVPHQERARILVTKKQAAALRLIAEGLSNAAIAERRGITIRSAESLVHRTFQALGLDDDSEINPRVMAAMMWRNGQITTRGEASPTREQDEHT